MMKNTMNNMTNNKTLWLGKYKRTKRYILTVLVLLFIVIALAAFMMIYGNTVYSPKTILEILRSDETKGAAFTIKTLRLPRMLAAVFCGLAFGLAGNTFQKLLGNPLASPDIIGVTSGASVAAVFAILILKLSGSIVSLLAVLSGLIVSAAIYFLAHSDGFSNGKLILTGIGMQAFLNALISWMLLKASEYDVASALRWLSGSLNSASMDEIPRLCVVVSLASLAIFLLNKHLEILELGETHAKMLGLRITAVRLSLILCALLLIAFATSVTGPIASVAFLAGPIATKISGGGKSNLLTSALAGCVLVMASDMIGQYAFPTRYPVGVITGILGAPYLILLLIRINKTEE